MASARARPCRRCCEAGCRDFFVSTWAEAEALGAAAGRCRAWSCCTASDRTTPRRRSHRAPGRRSTPPSRSRGGRRSRRGRPCDVMIDTGMNRLGLRPDEIGVLDGLDDRHAAQPSRLRRRGSVRSTRCSWSASARSRRRCRRSATASPIRAGICLGRDYSFDLVRPGPGALRRHSAARSRGQHPPGRARRGRDRPAPDDPGRRKLRLWRDLRRRGGHRGGDPQHRLRRRLSARLLVARARRSPASSRCRCSGGCRWI